MPAALLRMTFVVALPAERDAVAQLIREVWSLRDRHDVVRDLCRNHAPVPLAILTEILITTQDLVRPLPMPLLVVHRID